MPEKIVRFVNIFHPAYLGGSAYAITQQSLYETSEKALQIAGNWIQEGRLLHDCVKIEFTPECDEHAYEVPEGCIVRFVNIQRPDNVRADNYATGQVALYPTAEAARAQAKHLSKGYWMISYYIAMAVPVIFKGLPMADGWVEQEGINYKAVHREELLVIDMTPTDYTPEVIEKYKWAIE